MGVVPKPIPEWHDVDADVFRTRIRPQARPAVLRGLVRHWPATAAAATSTSALATYLKSMYCGVPVPLFEGPPQIEGRFFYDATYQGFNFQAQRAPLDTVIDRLLAQAGQNSAAASTAGASGASANEAGPDGAPTLYCGSLSLPIYLPGFTANNPLNGLIQATSCLESIWIGNRTCIAPHFDASENIACVVAGRRRFTLFPPEQVSNLYVGPPERTPAGQPISLVDVRRPDLERFPKYAAALQAALIAELGPGDAIYIPTLWWHGVEALAPFNVLVNYWWQEAPGYAEPPMNSLLHCLLSLASLPADQRRSWKALFDYFIFQTDGAPLEYLPPQARGLFGGLTPETADRVRSFLAKELTRRSP